MEEVNEKKYEGGRKRVGEAVCWVDGEEFN